MTTRVRRLTLDSYGQLLVYVVSHKAELETKSISQIHRELVEKFGDLEISRPSVVKVLKSAGIEVKRMPAKSNTKDRTGALAGLVLRVLDRIDSSILTDEERAMLTDFHRRRTVHHLPEIGE